MGFPGTHDGTLSCLLRHVTADDESWDTPRVEGTTGHRSPRFFTGHPHRDWVEPSTTGICTLQIPLAFEGPDPKGRITTEVPSGFSEHGPCPVATWWGSEDLQRVMYGTQYYLQARLFWQVEVTFQATTPFEEGK